MSIPLIVIDTYEHAFYIDYQNRKAEYVEKFIDHTEVGHKNKHGSLANFPVLIDITDADLQLTPIGKVENASG